MEDVTKRYLSVKEAAAVLGVGRSAIHRAIERGRIVPAFEAAGALWIDPADIEKYRKKYSRPRRKASPGSGET